MQRVLTFLDRLFSFFIFVVIILLAVYMCIRISFGSFFFFSDLLHGGFIPDESSRRMLQGIAETVILIKAYRILVSYLKTHHVSIKYIVEISIVAPAIELLFAYNVHTLETKIIFAVFGISNVILYALFFRDEKETGNHQLSKSCS